MALAKQKSENVSKVRKEHHEDARTVQTRQRIDRAFVELLAKRAYGSIRVSDITRKARVGRATFYAHHASKDELLRSQLRRIVWPMIRSTPGGACPVDATLFIAHVQTASVLYRSLMSSPNAGTAPRIIREALEQHIGHSLSRDCEQQSSDAIGSDLQNAIVARCVASSLISVIECALERQANESPETLQTFFSRLVGGGLTAFHSTANP